MAPQLKVDVVCNPVKSGIRHFTGRGVIHDCGRKIILPCFICNGFHDCPAGGCAHQDGSRAAAEENGKFGACKRHSAGHHGFPAVIFENGEHDEGTLQINNICSFFNVAVCFFLPGRSKGGCPFPKAEPGINFGHGRLKNYLFQNHDGIEHVRPCLAVVFIFEFYSSVFSNDPVFLSPPLPRP